GQRPTWGSLTGLAALAPGRPAPPGRQRAGVAHAQPDPGDDLLAGAVVAVDVPHVVGGLGLGGAGSRAGGRVGDQEYPQLDRALDVGAGREERGVCSVTQGTAG